MFRFQAMRLRRIVVFPIFQTARDPDSINAFRFDFHVPPGGLEALLVSRLEHRHFSTTMMPRALFVVRPDPIIRASRRSPRTVKLERAGGGIAALDHLGFSQRLASPRYQPVPSRITTLEKMSARIASDVWQFMKLETFPSSHRSSEVTPVPGKILCSD